MIKDYLLPALSIHDIPTPFHSTAETDVVWETQEDPLIEFTDCDGEYHSVLRMKVTGGSIYRVQTHNWVTEIPEVHLELFVPDDTPASEPTRLKKSKTRPTRRPAVKPDRN